MENQTPRPDGIPSKRHVHVVLILTLIPVVAAGVGWIIAVGDVLKGYANRAQLTWSRILVGLVVVDTFVAIAWIWSIGHPEELKKVRAVSGPPKSVIGVQFDPPDDAGAVPVIGAVVPGQRAERAGLREGDLLLDIDGTAVKTQREAIQVLGQGEPEKPRKFRILRDDEEQEIEVVPSAYPKVPLFQVVSPEEKLDWLRELRDQLPALGFGLLAWAVGWWRFGDRGKGWLGILICILGMNVAAILCARLIVQSMGGLSVGGYLLAMAGGSSSLVVLGLLVRKLFPDAPANQPASGSIVSTYFLGVFYMIVGVLRLSRLLSMADLLWFDGQGSTDRFGQMASATNLGSVGVLLLVVDTLIFAPIGEELVFRGFLLPKLLAQKGPVWAVGVSAVFFGLLHWNYGVYIPLIVLHGVVLGWARLRSGGLAAPMLLHLSVNALAMVRLLT